METRITDCGRKEASVKERGDCTVRAGAACLSAMGRKNRRGFRFRAKAAEDLGLQTREDLSCMTVAKAMVPMKAGRFIVRVRKHVFAVIDGVAIDTFPVRPGSHVLMAYQLL